MIRRLLIANRGEVAVRIIRACRELGIESVAVHSSADVRSPHVLAADRAVPIGPAAAAQSYLSIPTLIDAARSSLADAVHPGYGFLSENPAFADACTRAGFVWVGPPAPVIALMGSKIESRKLMEAAGVPIVPGTTPADQSDEGVRRAVGQVGLPAIVKASAGGGGKGMRLVRTQDEVVPAVQSARREAAAAFGDGTLYVERFIERARHIEVQVFADAHGQVDHLFERDCSVQRRHQKVIEESPAHDLTASLRTRLTDAAVAAARSAGYRNAGTIEFLVEGSGEGARFYFLEMNTRLQVEHPITEEVTGVDLVHAQLTVASGGRLPWTAGALGQRGHAIEARVYAEDPSRGFLPEAGRLLLYREPRLPGVRVDSGVAEGGDVAMDYDPLIAKVIAHAETRRGAIARLAAALRDFPILGIATNIPFLLRVLEHPRFIAGETDTAFLDAEAPGLAAADDPDIAGAPSFVRAALTAASRVTEVSASNVDSRREWDPLARLMGDTITRVGPGVYRVESDGASSLVYVAGSGDDRWAFWNGRVFRTAARKDNRASQGAAHGAAQRIEAPMPATVVRVLVETGASVKKGDTLVLLEAMKMELPMQAVGDATVTAVRCHEGEKVEAGAVLVELT